MQTSHTTATQRTATQAWIAAQQSAVVADLMELSNQNSGSEHLAGLLRVAQWLEDRMDLHRAEFQRVPLPHRRVINEHGDELALETAPALRWDFQPQASRRVLLCIHYDTVFGEQHPFQSCQPVTSDRLQGPGVADAKGGILVLRTAVQALLNFELCGELGWTVLLTPDEELGSPSSEELLERLAGEFDFGLLFEPALPDGGLVSQRKGSGNYTLIVHGRAAHAGRHFEHGRNAVVALCQLLTKLDALNHQYAGLTINVGQMQGGAAVNIVPDLAIGRLNIRVQDQAAFTWFAAQLQYLVDELNARSGFKCRVVGGLGSPPKSVSDRMQQLMRAIEAAQLSLGGAPLSWRATGGVCDGNKLAAAGLVNIDTLGPLGDGLHSPSEWVSTSSIVERAQLVVELLSRFASGEYAALERQRLEAE